MPVITVINYMRFAVDPRRVYGQKDLYGEVTMDRKFVVGLACSAALLLGACSGNNPPGTTSSDTNNGGSTGNDGTDGNGGTDGNANGGSSSDDGEASTADERYNQAVRAVRAAILAAQGATTEAEKNQARGLIETARTALTAAVTAANAAVTAAADGSPAEIGAAARSQTRANDYLEEQTEELNRARASLAWYGSTLVRFKLANGAAVLPAETTVEVERTNIKTANALGGADGNVNPFKAIKYSDGKKVFADTGDEFEVQGYVTQIDTNNALDPTVLSGLKLTSDGLEIRTGYVSGARDISGDGTPDGPVSSSYDYPDFTRNLNVGGAPDSNLWDLKITFKEPQTMTVPGAPDGETWVSSWNGNGDFYWRSLVPLDKTQQVGGANYAGDAFHSNPVGFRNVGTYEVWLSNHIGIDTNLEPPAGETTTCLDGSRGTSCPDDDENLYLDYAAYGLFVFISDPDVFDNRGYYGRVQSMHFGYEAFGTADGQRTSDINEAITSGRFLGETIAYAFQGDRGVGTNAANPTKTLPTKLLRGDVSLTVTIPKTSGTGTLTGEMTNFEEWFGNRVWRTYTEPGADFKVTLNDGESTPAAVNIGTDGSFRGVATATPSNRLNRNGKGYFYGNFYGPRGNADDLEAAGSWEVGVHSTGSAVVQNYYIFGSFGAKQRPISTPGS